MLTKQDLSAIGKVIGKKIDPIRKGISRIRTDQKAIISFFDNEFIELRNRVEKIERHLGITAN